MDDPAKKSTTLDGYERGCVWQDARRMNHLDSRVKYLRLALQEAVRVGDTAAAKRLTKQVMDLIAKARTLH